MTFHFPIEITQLKTLITFQCVDFTEWSEDNHVRKKRGLAVDPQKPKYPAKLSFERSS